MYKKKQYVVFRCGNFDMTFFNKFLLYSCNDSDVSIHFFYKTIITKGI